MGSRKVEQDGDWINEISLEIVGLPYKTEPGYPASWDVGTSHEQEKWDQDMFTSPPNVRHMADSQPSKVAGGTANVQIRVVIRAGADGRTHSAEPVEISTLFVMGSGQNEQRYSLRCTHSTGRRATGWTPQAETDPAVRDQAIGPKF